MVLSFRSRRVFLVLILSLSLLSPPFSAMDINNRNHMDDDTKTIYMELTKQTVDTSPFYQGEYESLHVTNRVPSMKKIVNLEVDSANLHALLFTPIIRTLPLMEILKLKAGVASYLTEQGVWNENIHLK